MGRYVGNMVGDLVVGAVGCLVGESVGMDTEGANEGDIVGTPEVGAFDG